jgi:Tfp pilus assembly protein PilN
MHLDFIQPRRPASPWGWVLLALGFLLCAALLQWRYATLEPQLQTARDQLRKLQSDHGAPLVAVVRLSDKQLKDDWIYASKVAQELSAPWSDLLTVFEGASNQPVALLSVELDGVRQDLLINAEARNYEAMLNYYRYLQQQALLTSVALQAHQVNQQDQDKPVRFRITAQWERTR